MRCRRVGGPDLRYVCLSDLHFGAENSILTELRPGTVEVDGPLRLQVNAEREPQEAPLAEQVTFVFGHTHKPFTTRVTPPAYHQPIDVHNTGGWVVDTVQRAPLQGGTAVLVSDSLDVVSLSMYRQTLDSNPSRAEPLIPDGTAPSAFLLHLQSVVRPEQPPWSTFSADAARLVSQRHRDLATILELRVEA